MPILPDSYSSDCQCLKGIGEDGYIATTIENMKDNFKLSPDYRKVFIIPDSSKTQDFLHDKTFDNTYGVQSYDAWVFDGTEEERTVGFKYIQMYPYKTPVFGEGQYISFDYYNTGLKSTWLSIALNSSSEYEQIGKIRMCTNEIRFYDDLGKLIRIPCVFDDKINSQKNVSLRNMKYINGITTIFAQMNEDSNKLHANQRLLFGRVGNWTAFKIVSVGVNNFMNTTYFDNESAKIFEITMEANYVNEDADDIINGIADAPKFLVEINQKNILAKVGDPILLEASVFKDGIKIPSLVSWTSSNPLVATVDGSGNVACVSTGVASIRASMDGNVATYAETTITVSNTTTAEYQVVIFPYEVDSFGIIQGESETFSCYLYKNGIKQLDEFTFTILSKPVGECFVFTELNRNNFSIKNNKMSKTPIVILCASGANSFTATINLKGAW